MGNRKTDKSQLQKCTTGNVQKVHNSKREQTQNSKIAKLQILKKKINKYKIQNPKVGIPKSRIPKFCIKRIHSYKIKKLTINIERRIVSVCNIHVHNTYSIKNLEYFFHYLPKNKSCSA